MSIAPITSERVFRWISSGTASIVAMHASGTKIVMVTHNLGQARRLGDEILFMHQGRLSERTPADRFFRDPASREAAQFLEAVAQDPATSKAARRLLSTIYQRLGRTNEAQHVA